MKTKLSIGCAVFDDFSGLYFTLMSLRMHHAEVMDRCELIVIDNNPGSADGQMTAGFMGSIAQAMPIKYIPFTEAVGTSAPRDRIFREASGDAVMCMDSHVLLPAGSLKKLLDYYDHNPTTRDLLSGPMLYDNLSTMTTHFSDVWREQMWGIWGLAWDCKCGRSRFQVLEEAGKAVFCNLMPNQDRFVCPHCSNSLPPIDQFAGHEDLLIRFGFKPSHYRNIPFEVPAMGLGMFTCRKAAWLGFNPAFRGFGGEEFYIHEKFRQAGAKCLCLPFIPWGHRFGRPQGVPYPNTVFLKCRNYVIGHLEIGRPLDPIKENFVDNNLLPLDQWQNLIADPLREMPVGEGCNTCNQPSVTQLSASLEELFAAAANTPSDINEHAPILKSLATQVASVTEFGMRPAVSTVALLAGQPKKFLTIAPNDNSIMKLLKAKQGDTDFEFRQGTSPGFEIEPTDLLFIDTVHTANQLTAELIKYAPKVSRWIARHDTVIFGENGEDQGPGLLYAIRQFLKENEDWFIAFHAINNHGLTVLGRRPEDEPKSPIWLWPSRGSGPGTELKALLAIYNIVPGPECDCQAKAAMMDEWGTDRCRRNRTKIVQWLEEGSPRWGWKDYLAAAAKTLTAGLAFRLDPFDAIGSLVDEAIRLAVQKETP